MKIFTCAAGIAGLMLAFPSLAQDTTAAGTTMGQTWDAPLADTFFNPGGSMTLRTEPEIQASWASLTDDQKQQVRNDCAAFGTDNAAMDAGASGGAAGGVADTTAGAGASATGETAGDTQGAAATASPDPAEGTDAATDMTQPKSGSTENATVAEDDGSTGAGESTLPAGTVAEGSAATGSEPASGMDPSAVSLTTWTQICAMVEDF